MHHYTSGFKSLFSQTCYEDMDICRQSLGGVGISSHAGIAGQFLDYAPVAVFEGDNTVMAKQNINYIQKKIKKIVEGKPAKGHFSYLNHLAELSQTKSTAKNLEEFISLEHLDECMASRAAFWCNKVIPAIAESKENKKRIYNDIFAQDLLSLSKAHMLYLALKIGRATIEETKFKDPNVAKILTLCTRVWCLQHLSKDSHVLFENGFFGQGAMEHVRQGLQQVLQELRPHMIPIVETTVDNWSGDWLTCVGNKYGDIYETQLEWAMGSRLNKGKPEYFDELCKPIYTGMRKDAKL